MTTLRELINRLTPEQREYLDVAFEDVFARYVMVNDYYVGVHLIPTPELIESERVGFWSCGKLKKGTQ
jgi:hypothetical protein